ncbi:Dynein assembly factor 5, axonemal [Hondaea fermentalgiana]|uniref:Dynein assembly factor 5, axonemal n=1 Tax=Hondaea fermentalgiana TaxID=2315210 RepID=A0A2R5G6J4_9STRA|nr:Dynein assembly factor 5, axonemal [Hondaea fermentalgiana]|eukprot:GBG26677.1 Dynein assembly factor 5, axonemal [Hondaea fermentalgiana]
MDPLMAKFQRDINCAADDDRTTRTRALKKLDEAAFGRRSADELDEEGARTKLLNNGLLQTLVDRFADPAEKCRELSVSMLTKFVQDDAKGVDPKPGRGIGKATVEAIAALSIEAAEPRLCESPFPEGSEEIRLALVELLAALIDHPHAHDAIERKFSNIARIITRASTDTFPDCKKECAACVTKLCAAFSDTVHRQFETLLDALVANLGHQHAKVRQACLDAIKALAVSCAASAATFQDVMHEKVVPAIRNVNHDRASAVRIRGIELISELLRTMPDSTVYRKDLLPILIFGLADQAMQIQQMTLEVVERLGQSLAGDAIEAAAPPDPPATISLPEPFAKRPGAGARQLVVNILPSALPKLLQEARDWTAQERFRAVALMRCFVVFAEDAMQPFLREICETLFVVAMDDEQSVRDTAADTARLLGHFCSTEALLDLVLPACLGQKAAGDAGPEEGASRRLGALACLAGITLGLPSRPGLHAHLARISATLNDPALERAATNESAIQVQVLQAISGLLEHAYASNVQDNLGPLNRETICNVLRVLFILITSPGDEDLAQGAEESLVLAAACGDFFTHVAVSNDADAEPVPSVSAMVEACCSGLLPADASQAASWTKFAADRRVFDQAVRRTGVAGLARQSQLAKVVQVLAVTTPADRDADLRLCMLSLLEAIIASSLGNDTGPDSVSDKENRGPLDAFAPALVSKVLGPNLVWRAGRVPSTIRKVSMFCLSRLAAVASDAQTQWYASELDGLFPTLKACLDDLDTDTRRFTCMALREIYGLLVSHKKELSRTVVADGYHDIIKRLDDADDRVRIVACEALVNMIRGAPLEILKGTPTEYIVDTALIHMDDAEASVQQAVFGIVEALVQRGVDLGKISAKAASHRARHRSPDLCDRLVAMCEQN